MSDGNDVSRDAGRELDALVAERVFGAEWGPLEPHELAPPSCVARLRLRYLVFGERFDNGRADLFFGSLETYSTDITAAWKVLAKLWEAGTVARTGRGTHAVQIHRRDGTAMFAHLGFGGEHPAIQDAWICEIATDPEGDFSTHSVGVAETAPHAICLAALKAVEAR